ncbi:MAG: cytochrome c3 family protein [Deltaproteobacteria bacterium]|nr:cytochrome c3 family protein [Deltaproteobacteria bacterium]
MRKIVTIAFIAGLFLPPSTLAIENIGRENMMLQGGSSGDVPFPHHRHQTALGGDCNLCHSLFPQVSGSIEKLEAEGKLKKKQAMVQCRTCHKTRVSKGQKAGPVKCRGCHKK